MNTGIWVDFQICISVPLKKLRKEWLLPSLYIRDETKKVKKYSYFTPLCRMSKTFVKTV